MTLQLGVAYQDGWGTLDEKYTACLEVLYIIDLQQHTAQDATKRAKGYASVMGLGARKK